MSTSVCTGASADYYGGGGGGGAEAPSYYLDDVVPEEPPGRWSGALATRLGLVGDVTDEDLQAVLGHLIDPRTGDPIGTRLAQRRSAADVLADRLAQEPDALPERIEQIRVEVDRAARRAPTGYDFTLGLVKSLSVVHAAAQRAQIAATRSGDADRLDLARSIRSGIEEAIEAGNRAGIEYLTGHVMARRASGSGGATEWLHAPGLIVASFFQHTNRNADPHLHVHNVIINRAECEDDGRIRAVDFQDLKEHRHAAGSIADRVAEEHLAAMGFRVELRPDGVARELVVAPAEVCAKFSSRHEEIEAALAPLVAELETARGRQLTAVELWHVHKQTTLATRQGKHASPTETVEERLSRLDAELLRLGQTLEATFDATVRHLAAGGVEARAWSPAAVISSAVAAVSEAHTTWGRPQLIKELHLALPTLGVTGPDAARVLESLADAALTSPMVVQITGAEAAGEQRFAAPTSARYAAAGTIAAEEAIRAAAVLRGGHSIPAGQVQAWLGEHAPTVVGARGKTTDQQAAIEGIASSGALVSMLVGPAGAGKSFAVGTLAGAWADLSEGGRVIGLAVSDAATNVLVDDGVADSINTTRFLNAAARMAAGRPVDGDTRWQIGPRDLVLVDEASMATSSQAQQILDQVRAAGARMVLTGDHRQLGAVGAGGVMGLLDGQAETYTLSTVRRFREPWERAASLRLRDGDLEVLTEYDRHGRIHSYSTAEAAVEAIGTAVVADLLAGRTTTTVCATNAMAARVAHVVRGELVALGRVDGDGPSVRLGRDGNQASRGDVITARHNDPGLQVTNQLQYVVAEVTDDGGLLVHPVGADPDSGTMVLPSGYVDEHTQLAYAGTVHATQGKTLDTCHALTTGDLDAHGLYVGATRGKITNEVHVVCEAPTPVDSPEDIEQPPDTQIDGGTPHATGITVLEGCLARTPTDRAALVEADDDQAHRQSTATTMARIEHLTRAACRDRLDRHLDDLASDGVLPEADRARLGADQATEHLSRVLRAVEQAGQDPRQVLADAVAARPLASATSPAQALSWRIRGTSDVPLPSPGAARVPDGITAGHTEVLDRLHARAETRRTQLGQAAALDPPAWAVLLLGPVPDTESARHAEWIDRAGTIAACREATGWDHDTDPIGRPRGLASTEHRALYARAWEAAGRPPTDLVEAAMPTGRLLARTRAAETTRAWAPAHTDDALRAAEVTARSAARDAELARARAAVTSDTAEAARLRAESAARSASAELHQLAAAELGRQAEARTAWYARSLTTLDLGARAKTELERRGIDPDATPDQVTADQWLAADRAARSADDAHRVITEADMVGDRVAPLSDEEACALPEVPLDQVPEETAGLDLSRVSLPAEAPTAFQLELNAAAASHAHRVAADLESQDQHVPVPEHTVTWDDDHATGQAQDDAA